MSDPTWVSRETALALHTLLIDQFGGLDGVRDDGLLDSALARPQQALAYATPTLAELAAAYAHGIVRNHPFADGNKRTALAVADVFSQLNGNELTASEVETVVVFRDLAAGEIAEAELAAWIGANLAAV